MNNKHEEYIGKVVASRGIGSGVIIGRLIGFGQDSKTLVLTESFFLKNWKYKNSFGSMYSLSSGDILPGGDIAKIHNDTIITDCAVMVVCPDDILEKIEKMSS